MSKKSKGVVLIGFKHCGKSTIGKALANILQSKFIDIDAVIEKLSGFSCRKLYLEKGSKAFIDYETKASQSIVTDDINGKFPQGLVIATGGGICENTDAVTILKEEYIFVYLQISEEIALERILNEAKSSSEEKCGYELSSLPAWLSREKPTSPEMLKTLFHNYYEKRCNSYAQIADVTIFVGEHNPLENAEGIKKAVSLL